MTCRDPRFRRNTLSLDKIGYACGESKVSTVIFLIKLHRSARSLRSASRRRATAGVEHVVERVRTLPSPPVVVLVDAE